MEIGDEEDSGEGRREYGGWRRGAPKHYPIVGPLCARGSSSLDLCCFDKMADLRSGDYGDDHLIESKRGRRWWVRCGGPGD